MPGTMRVFEARYDTWRVAPMAAFAVLATLLIPLPASAQAPQVAPSATEERSAPLADAPAAAQAAPPETAIGQPVPQNVEAAQIPAPGKPGEKPGKVAHDLSPMGMFLAADPVVQGVMILLVLASVMTWTVLVVKVVGLSVAKRRMRIDLDSIRDAGNLREAADGVRRGVAAHLLIEAEEEIGLSRGLPDEGVKERVAIALVRIEARAARSMAVGTGILATVGSIGPFVGLFGTVWGIMRSFIGIANSNTTNLAVVAPGIAEALLATGIGLVAAIPAVVIYNALTRSIAGYRAMAGDATALIVRHVSRDLDRRALDAYDPKSNMRIAAE